MDFGLVFGVQAGFLGSFDPLTLGHLDLIERASQLFSGLVIGVGDNPKKNYLFTHEERLSMVVEACRGVERTKVLAFSGLAVDFCQENSLKVLIRGLRGPDDLAYEMRMAGINRELSPSLDSIFLPTRSDFMNISSSMVKELASLGASVESMVPSSVRTRLIQRFQD